MSISRLRPDGNQVLSQTVITTLNPSASQVFDLGQIRVAYIEITLTAANLDTLTLGTLGTPGTVTYQVGGAGVTGVEHSRDGVVYVAAGLGSISLDYDGTTPPLPQILAIRTVPIARYVKVSPVITDNTTGVPYAGVKNPTGTWSMYLEYV